MFADYLATIPSEHADTLTVHVVQVVHELQPEATEGLSYGLPAFKLYDRPLVGFSSNKHGLNVYPYDPRIIQQVIDEFPDLDHSKGVIRFTPEKPIPKKAVELMVSLRLSAINKA